MIWCLFRLECSFVTNLIYKIQKKILVKNFSKNKAERVKDEVKKILK